MTAIEITQAIDEITETLKATFANPLDITWDDVDREFFNKYGFNWYEENGSNSN